MDAEEVIGAISESDPGLSRRKRSRISFSIAILGWLIIGSTLNTIIFSFFPLKLATPEWQLSLIAALISSSFAFLVGSILIGLAPHFSNSDNVLRNWQRTMSRLAGLFAVLLVLFIPLQFYLGLKVLNAKTNSSLEAISNLKAIAKGIAVVNSETELRMYLASLPNPPAVPEKFEAPFPDIKSRAIQNITAQINTETYNVQIGKSEALQTFLKEAIRNSSQAILWAAGFSVLANFSSNAKNPVVRFFTALL
jgi:hypothetical protein